MNELFIIKPNLHQYYGRTITKEMKFDEKTDDGRVHQILENLILTTIVHQESEYDGVKSIEDSKMVQELPEGTILIWNEKDGYILPNVMVCKMKDLEKDIKVIKDIYKDNKDMNNE